MNWLTESIRQLLRLIATCHVAKVPRTGRLPPTRMRKLLCMLNAIPRTSFSGTSPLRPSLFPAPVRAAAR